MEYKVLICDDEPLEREVLSLIIERSGLPFKVVGEAKNGIEALEKAENLKPDVILMDIKMPGKDGLRASEEIKNILNNVKIIIITAYDELDFVKEALKLGSVDYLLKPIRPEEFVAVLKKLFSIFEKEKEKIQREEELKIAIKKAEKMIKAGILAALIMGEVNSEEEINVLKMQAQMLNINSLPNSILIIEPEIDESQSMAEYERYEVLKTVEDILKDKEDIFLLNLGESIIVGMNNKNIDPNYIAFLIQNNIEQKMEILVTISILENNEGYINRKIFQEAKVNAQLGRFFFGGKVVSPQEIQELSSINEDIEFKKEDELLECVHLANLSQALKIFNEFMGDLIKHSKGSLFYCQARLAEIMLLIWRTVRKKGLIDEKNSHLYFSYLKKLSKAQSVSALTSCGKNFLIDIFSISEKNNQSINIVDRVVKYINENYDKDLKLKEITKMIYVNTEYFSRLFKKEVGCTYAEYITRVRIESARKYLSNPSLSVADVAKKVGYQDPNYFSKVFKKVIGITPSDYRKNLGILEN
ncbi:response regulator transcription factor [Thermovenabulum sp.]|uniref:response regulator transcription factor n=1 Tax=Thermovenabulum sp. TaxID=3100335 RepID=UPI003C7B1745